MISWRKTPNFDEAQHQAVDVDIYVAYGDQDLQSLAAQAAILDGQERARAASFVFATDRELFRASHVLLRHCLSRHADIAPAHWGFRRTARGRPEIDRQVCPVGSCLRFNLAHTRGFACCAVTRDAAVGIDAEENRPLADALEIAQRFFAPLESAAVADASPGVRSSTFLERWSLKEAYLKATGVGLSAALDGFAFRLADSEPAIVSMWANSVMEPEPENWRFGLFHVKDSTWIMAATVRTDLDAVFRVHQVSSVARPLSFEVMALSPAVRVSCNRMAWAIHGARG